MWVADAGAAEHPAPAVLTRLQTRTPQSAIFGLRHDDGVRVAFRTPELHERLSVPASLLVDGAVQAAMTGALAPKAICAQ